jgi:polyferredoxin
MADKSLEVQNYETNLKLHYEAKRKELDILLTSSIPQQLSNMKTILWVNFLMIALMLQLLKKFPLPEIVIGFFILSLASILTVLAAMLTNRSKSYGVPNDIFHMNKYADNKWTVSQATLDMMGTMHTSILENRQVITNRGRLMHLSTWFTLLTIFFAFLTFTSMQIL